MSVAVTAAPSNAAQREDAVAPGERRPRRAGRPRAGRVGPSGRLLRSARRRGAALAGLSLVIGLLAPVARSAAAVTTDDDPPPMQADAWGDKGWAAVWGDNEFGQLGDGTQATRTVQHVAFGEHAWTHAAAGAGHTVAVRVDGTAFAWGRNADGQLGDGTIDGHLIPQPVATLTDVTKVAAGRAHSLALRSDGTVWAWGDNAEGQLGTGTNNDRRRPARVLVLTGVTDIAAGGRFSLALRNDGTVWSWGDNADGQLGDGSRTDRLRPVRVPGLNDVVQIAAGARHGMALLSHGAAYSWGDNSEGALGDGTKISRAVPGWVSLLGNPHAVTRIAAGNGFSVAVVNGRPSWWGAECHQIDRDTSLCFVEVRPTAHAVNLTNVTAIAAGESHTIARRSDGTLWGWGSNALGQLGDGTTTYRAAPVRSAYPLDDNVGIAAGAHHTVALEWDVLLEPESETP
jgi:alpha-tubulin suppressor-like RCC1 family protein